MTLWLLKLENKQVPMQVENLIIISIFVGKLNKEQLDLELIEILSKPEQCQQQFSAKFKRTY